MHEFLFTLKNQSFLQINILVAFKKTAVLSSEYDKDHNATNAVDGIKVCPNSKLLAGAEYSVQPWLMIDLNGTYQVEKVIIYARTDGHGMSIQQL